MNNKILVFVFALLVTLAFVVSVSAVGNSVNVNANSVNLVANNGSRLVGGPSGRSYVGNMALNRNYRFSGRVKNTGSQALANGMLVIEYQECDAVVGGSCGPMMLVKQTPLVLRARSGYKSFSYTLNSTSSGKVLYTTATVRGSNTLPSTYKMKNGQIVGSFVLGQPVGLFTTPNGRTL